MEKHYDEMRQGCGEYYERHTLVHTITQEATESRTLEAEINTGVNEGD